MLRTDRINALFEWGGSVFIGLSVLQVLRDQQVAGINWATVLFFAVWGFWNLHYYRAVNHSWSLYAAATLAIVNTLYTGLLIYYG